MILFWPIRSFVIFSHQLNFASRNRRTNQMLPFFCSKGELKRQFKTTNKTLSSTIWRGAKRCKKHGSFKHERRNRKQNCTDKQWLFKRGQEEDALQDWRRSRSLRNEAIAVFASRAQSEFRNCEQHPVGPTNPRGTSMKK